MIIIITELFSYFHRVIALHYMPQSYLDHEFSTKNPLSTCYSLLFILSLPSPLTPSHLHGSLASLVSTQADHPAYSSPWPTRAHDPHLTDYPFSNIRFSIDLISSADATMTLPLFIHSFRNENIVCSCSFSAKASSCSFTYSDIDKHVNCELSMHCGNEHIQQQNHIRAQSSRQGQVNGGCRCLNPQSIHPSFFPIIPSYLSYLLNAFEVQSNSSVRGCE